MNTIQRTATITRPSYPELMALDRLFDLFYDQVLRPQLDDPHSLLEETDWIVYDEVNRLLLRLYE